MENEIRYYLKQILNLMTEPEEGENRTAFVPQYLVMAIKNETDAIELSVIGVDIACKINSILDAYDEDMHLKSNTDVMIQNIMIV